MEIKKCVWCGRRCTYGVHDYCWQELSGYLIYDRVPRGLDEKGNNFKSIQTRQRKS